MNKKNSSSMRHANTVSDSAQLWALFALIVYTPLPLASNRPWAIALLSLFTSVVLLWTLWQASGRSIVKPFSVARIPFVLLGLLVLLLVAQIIPMKEVCASCINNQSVNGLNSRYFDNSAVSIDPYLTRLYLAQACILSAIFWLVIKLVNSRQRIEWLFRVIIFSGLLQALVGVLLMSTGTRFMLFFTPLLNVRAHGTFVSPNNFAGYLELTLAVGIGFMIAKLDSRPVASWKRRLYSWVALLVSEKAMLRLSLIIMVVGLVASRSRMGNAAFFGGLLITGVITVIIAKYFTGKVREKGEIDTTRTMIMFIISLIVLDVIIIGGVVGVQKVLDRIEYTNLQTQSSEVQADNVSAGGVVADKVAVGVEGQVLRKHAQEESVEHRSAVARASIPIIQDYPWLGTGGGTFQLAFPRYSSAGITGFWDHAHNDYIEIASDLGLLGLLLFGLMVLHSGMRSVKLLAQSEDQLSRGLAFASLMGVVSMLIHASVDFNFQNPAIAMLFLIVLSLPYLIVRLRST